MTIPTLQQAIDEAGSPVKLLWKADAQRWLPPVVEPQFIGWREEQAAAYQTVGLSDQCHHMTHLFIEGPDALKLLSDYSANNYDNFPIGQAKQIIMVSEEGLMINDAVLFRDGVDKYTLSGVPAAASWVKYHAEKGNYNVSVSLDPDSGMRGGGNPVLFRYQIQGPRALDLVEQVFGGPLPKTKFFHSTPVTLDGRTFQALRHGMTGQPGYEFYGDWKHGDFVKQALLEAGQSVGLVQVGSMAYSLNGLESGWIPMPISAIYSSPSLRDYRESLSSFSFEGKNPLKGTFFSDDIDDYYSNPFEMGYGRLISFNHDFVGRDALEKSQLDTARERVTLVLDREQVREVWGGPEQQFEQSFGRYRVESNGQLIGVGCYTGSVAGAETILSLALVEKEYTVPGTEVTFVWGEHPGPGTDPDADAGFARIKATVQPSPYNAYARSGYRAD